MSAHPDVSVVLPTYNRAGEIASAILSALDQTAPPDSYELIVVNNNSTDETADVVAQLSRAHPGRIRAICSSRARECRTRETRELHAARGDIIAFFDDDVRFSHNWIETIRQTYSARPDLVCLGGRVLPDWLCPPPGLADPHALGSAGAAGFRRRADDPLARQPTRAHQRQPHVPQGTPRADRRVLAAVSARQGRYRVP